MIHVAEGSMLGELIGRWWLSAVIVTTVILLAFPGGEFRQSLALHGPSIMAGDWWLLFTGQLVHLGWNHMALNVLGYLFILVCFRRELRPLTELLLLIGSMVIVGLGIYSFNPEIRWYYGLSGALYGLLVSCALVSLSRMTLVSGLLLMFVVVKVAYEQLFAAPDRVTAEFIGGSVAVDAHLYGLLAGLALGGAWWWYGRSSKSGMEQERGS